MDGHEIRFKALGTPVPQGSKNSYNGRVVDVNATKLRAWRKIVSDSARLMLTTERPYGFHEPVIARLVFALVKPMSYGKSVTQHVRKPDLDKLVRAVLDGLTDSGIIYDDAQIVGILAAKAYCETGEYPGVTVSLKAWGAE
jgi:Holliday junction resolvase RusA-like endonuclease